MDQIMISIVIPVYNVENYIKKCIDSLLTQTYPYFEIICVDDGSTDASYEILKDYEKKESKIHVLKQKNQYAGVARNKGMDVAKGKYLLFIDADDFVEKDMLHAVVEKAESENVEILVYDAFRFDDVTQRVDDIGWSALRSDLFGNGIKAAEEIERNIFEFTIPAPWNKLYLRKFIVENGLRFQDLKRTNDMFFVFAAFSCAKRIGVLDNKLYFYRDNNKTSLQGQGQETPTIYAEALYKLKEWLEKRGYWDKFRKSFEAMATSMSLYNLNNMKSVDSYHVLADALRSEILPKLELGTGSVEKCLKESLLDGQEIVVYGAGVIAKAIVRYLLYQCNYSREKLSVVVSRRENNNSTLCGIKVLAFEELDRLKQNALVIIAMADRNTQEVIYQNIATCGFANSVKVGYEEFTTLIRKGIV